MRTDFSRNEGAGARGVLVAGAALLALAALSLGLSLVDLGRYRVVVALGIASLKAGVVGVSFMEVRREGATVHFAIAAGVVMVLLVVGLTSADVLTR